MATVVEICNAALARLGQEPVTSLEDGTKLADICKLNWPLVRDSVLRSYEWPCAITRVNLAKDPVAPEWGYDYRFPLPADYLRLLEVVDKETEFRVEGDFILANEDPLPIRYIRRVEETGYYDSMLVEALVAGMIKALSFTLTSSAAMTERASADFRETLQEAKSKTPTEKDAVDNDADFSWVAVR